MKDLQLLHGSQGDPYDVIIIGSGMGGLACTNYLARERKRKVLLLEAHPALFGGWVQTFTRGGYEINTGHHYTGLQFNEWLKRAGLGEDPALAMRELNPHALDTVIINGRTFSIPGNIYEYERRLCAQFPHDAVGIRGYFKAVAEMGRVMDAFPESGLVEILRRIAAMPYLARWGWQTHGAMLDHYIRDQRVKDILAVRSGNVGGAPSEISALVAVAMEWHYANGGFHENGGGGAIVNALIKSITRYGSEAHCNAPVTQILVGYGGRVAGVVVRGKPIYTRTVVSNAHPNRTVELLPLEYGRPEREKAATMTQSMGALYAFFAIDGNRYNLADHGITNGNIWVHRHEDVDATMRACGRGLPRQINMFFLSACNPKTGVTRKDGRQLLQAITFTSANAFARYAGRHDPAYIAKKEELLGQMLDATEETFPGLRAAVCWKNLGTTLTAQRYVHQTGAYGDRSSPEQMFLRRPQVTSIDGLYQCGASTGFLGMLGSAMTGEDVAKKILGGRGAQRRRGNPPIRVIPHGG